MDDRTRRQVATWLFALCALLFVMIVVGGITRLTRSGLSIVEWQPIVGTLPPLSEAQWLDLFDKYKLTPEYKQVNLGMSLAQFKSIFWWEYIHRLLGRLIGLGFLLPYLGFLLRKRLDRYYAWRLGFVFLLGAAQGAMGWYMVMSGLVDDPRVSHFRLTAHLGLAFAIFAAMFWIALDMLKPSPGRAAHRTRLSGGALALVALVFLMILSGGLVAGIRAGYAYNTFPLMNGHFVPPEIFMLEPWHLNFFNNMATVQFDHRLIAWLLMIVVPLMWWATRRNPVPPAARLAASCLLAAAALQVSLGITTLLLRVPVVLGAAHQGGAVLVFAAALWLAHALRPT
ncbi:MAG: heme A synthase [Betaproteobacteria bacterium]|nr:heme A synthase [Betaproteobacteria bacterium]